MKELLKQIGFGSGSGVVGGALFALGKWLIEKWLAKKKAV